MWSTTYSIYTCIFGSESRLNNVLEQKRRPGSTDFIKQEVDNILTKGSVLRVILNIHDTTIPSRTHTHPTHSQTSCLLSSSLSLGAPVPRKIQCMWGVSEYVSFKSLSSKSTSSPSVVSKSSLVTSVNYQIFLRNPLQKDSLSVGCETDDVTTVVGMKMRE